MKWPILILVIACAIAALAFVLTGGPAPGDVEVRVQDVSLKPLEEIPRDEWEAAAGKRILFGHQSVGRNILAGIDEIGKERPEFAISVVHGDAAALGDGAGFAETEVGKNQDPASKIRDFDQIVRQEGARLDVAILKLCYVDVRWDTDAKKLFETYRDAMAKLRKGVPGTRLMHCTVPLTTIHTDWKSRARRMVGKEPADDAANRVRQQFNTLMRAEYTERGSLIDIAAAESTLPDGTRVTWKTGDVTYHCLAACYTDDGGHLNDLGRRLVARLALRQIVKFAAGR